MWAIVRNYDLNACYAASYHPVSRLNKGSNSYFDIYCNGYSGLVLREIGDSCHNVSSREVF